MLFVALEDLNDFMAQFCLTTGGPFLSHFQLMSNLKKKADETMK